MQRLLTALASQSINPEVLPPPGQPYHQQHLIAPSPYSNSSHQLTQGTGNSHPNVASPARLPTTFDYASANALSPFTLSLLGAPSEPDPLVLQQQDDRLQRTYKNTAEINNDVDELQSNIQSLIQSLGIDPGTLDSALSSADAATGVGGGRVGSAPQPGSDMDMFPPVDIGTGQDFDFDAFLMDMPRANDEDGDLDKLAEKLDPSRVMPKVPESSKIGHASSEQLHAFLNGVASQDGCEGVGGRGMPQLHGSPFKVPPGVANGASGAVSGVGVALETATGTRGRKRKSDVIVDGTHVQMPLETQGRTTTPVAMTVPPITNTRSKRKR